MPRPKIFISYSHKDEREVEELVSHLSVLQNAAGLVEVWNDQRIRAGADWKSEIEQAMSEASVAILLISRNFLNSDFILNNEVPKLLKRRAAEGLTVFPVLAKPCLWEEVPWLAAMNVRPKDNRAVWRAGGRYADDELTRIAREVVQIVRATECQQQAATTDTATDNRTVGINMDGGARVEARDVTGRDHITNIYYNTPPPSAPTPAAESRTTTPKNELTLTLAPNVTLELVRVPAGEFVMGSDTAKDNAAYDDELPPHKVYLDEYLIGKYPVTVAQFDAFVKAKNYQTTAEQKGSSWADSEGKEVKGADWRNPRGSKSDVAQKQNHPVTHISWNDAVAFCQWASEVSHGKAVLPSEAEWEKAARGTDGRIWPWDSTPGPNHKLCNFNMNVGDTTPSADTVQRATALAVVQIWRAMCGSGQAACLSRILIVPTIGTRILMRRVCACGAAARSTTLRGACGVPSASGTAAPSATLSISVSAWSRLPSEN